MNAVSDLNSGFSPAPAVKDDGAARRSAEQGGLPANRNANGAAGDLRGLLSAPLLRRSLPAIVVVLVLAGFGFLYLWLEAGDYRVLYPGMSEVDRSEAFELLTSSGLPVRLDRNSGSITVPSDRYYEARMALASAGLPRDATSSAMEYLTNQSSMTTSQFMEEAKYSAAIESELAKSIVKISTIQSARVHIAAPRQSAFVRNRIPTKASVVVVPYAGRSVSQAQVQAITHLVASSVPYLAVSDVSVVDQQGNLLTNTLTPSLNQASLQSGYERGVEEGYRGRIEALLAPLVGLNNVKVDVDVAMDFTELESTYEEYDQNGTGPKSRSEVLIVDRTTTSAAQGVPGSSSNIAPNDTVLSQPEPGQATNEASTVNGVSSSQTTRNYELDKSIRYVRNPAGQITRLSVAVVINQQIFEQSEALEGITLPAGTSSEEFTAKMTELIRAAVGFDQIRGDSVTVLTSPFVPELQLEQSTLWYEDSNILSLIRYGAAFLAFLVLIMGVLRPVVRMYQPAVAAMASAASNQRDGELSDAERQLISLGKSDSLEEIKARLKPKKSALSADMLDTANTYDDKVALIRLLVAEDSGRVANVLKKMIKPV